MREFLGIDKALTRIKGELANNAGKLTEIDAAHQREKITSSLRLEILPICRYMRRGSKESSPIYRKSGIREVGDRISQNRKELWHLSSPESGRQSRRFSTRIMSLEGETQTYSQRTRLDNYRSTDVAWIDHFNDNFIAYWRCCSWFFNTAKKPQQAQRVAQKQTQSSR